MTPHRRNKKLKMHLSGSHTERFLRGVGFLHSCCTKGPRLVRPQTDSLWLPVTCFQEFTAIF
jgi:hypothetical protein